MYSSGRAIKRFNKDILTVLVVRHLNLSVADVQEYYKDMLVDALCDYVSLYYCNLISYCNGSGLVLT